MLCKALSHRVYWNKDSVRKSIGLIPEFYPYTKPEFFQSLCQHSLPSLPTCYVRSSDCPTKWPVFPVAVFPLLRWRRRGHCRRLRGRVESNPFAVLCERKNWIDKSSFPPYSRWGFCLWSLWTCELCSFLWSIAFPSVLKDLVALPSGSSKGELSMHVYRSSRFGYNVRGQ
jgi:hypothetical protein